MSQSEKYGRTYHFPFSPGTTSDDRINYEYWSDIQKISEIVITEKLDGENTCLNQFGVFARSHVAPTIHPWTAYLKQRCEIIRKDLGELEIFGENLYAIHSIEYPNIENHFFVFAVRDVDQWLSWDEVQFYAKLLDFQIVPEIEILKMPFDQDFFEAKVKEIIRRESIFNSFDVITKETCSMEGVVCRNSGSFCVDTFKNNVFKYVRKGHVKTDEHWTKNWKRAKLKWEKEIKEKDQSRK